jgi:hypothetical protein
MYADDIRKSEESGRGMDRNSDAVSATRTNTRGCLLGVGTGEVEGNEHDH